jgi:hypothetical protein
MKKIHPLPETENGLTQTKAGSQYYPTLSWHFTETPLSITDYSDPQINFHELEDYHLSIFMTNTSDVSKPKEDDVRQDDPDEKDLEVMEESENINFPDFPTYPPDDDIYIAPVEKESTG